MKTVPRSVAGVLIVLGVIARLGPATTRGEGPEAKGGREASSPRPGLTARQTKEAVELAGKAMHALREKTEGATRPEADPREYVVNVELLANKRGDRSAPEKAKDIPVRANDDTSLASAGGPRAVVTSYRYFDDVTVFSIVELGTGRVVDVQVAQHLRTPLSDEEYEEAKGLAREKSGEIKQLFAKYGDRIGVYPQFSQYKVKGDARIHRVVQLTYRVGGKDLSHPRPAVDLTTRGVEILTPEAPPQPGTTRGPRPE